MELQMSQTVAGVLVDVLEQIGVKHIFGLIGNSLNLPLPPAATRDAASSAGPNRLSLAKHIKIYIDPCQSLQSLSLPEKPDETCLFR